VTRFDDALIVPGFVDTHIHFPQIGIMAAHGANLMDWLDTYVFPAEARFGEPGHAVAEARFFLDELLRNGTTTAMVFGSVHRHSVDALFAEALNRNMRLIAGKVLMDRNVPDALRDTPRSGHEDSARLIEDWHGKGRLAYAITPRFAPACSEQQLELAGRLLAENHTVYLQTHLSEDRREIGIVHDLFPNMRDYLAVYERFGLATGRSVFAHGIHLCDDEFARLGAAGSALAFCPTSNLFLGSGLFNHNAAQRHGIRVGLGTDVGAGTSCSLLRTMDEAYKVVRLCGDDLDPFHLFYLATLGGAKALNLDGYIGNFTPGKEADFLILDLAATPLLAHRLAQCRTLAEKIFILSILGDDRLVARTFLAGTQAHARTA
jgi:guanine deaminase